VSAPQSLCLQILTGFGFSVARWEIYDVRNRK
jgi:hypothetical protein